jgi:hypothetical protein
VICPYLCPYSPFCDASTGDRRQGHLEPAINAGTGSSRRRRPASNIWQEGEIDFLGGTPQQPGIEVFQIGGCTPTSNPCKVVWQSQWPSTVESGLHEMTVLWNPTTGDSFYLDGKLFATAPPSASVGIPSTPHIPAMQIQDMGQNSSVPKSSPLTAKLYWVARYAYK